MTNEPDKSEFLELYKLHAELADRVSQRREAANRLYVSLLAGLAAFLAVLIRFGVGNFPLQVVLVSVGTTGMALAVSWGIIIRSYRQLNSGKFLALHELERNLTYPFFQREWDLLGEGKSMKKYWRLTVVEISLPCIFFAIFLAIVVCSFFIVK